MPRPPQNQLKSSKCCDKTMAIKTKAKRFLLRTTLFCLSQFFRFSASRWNTPFNFPFCSIRIVQGNGNSFQSFHFDFVLFNDMAMPVHCHWQLFIWFHSFSCSHCLQSIKREMRLNGSSPSAISEQTLHNLHCDRCNNGCLAWFFLRMLIQ